ncbi:MAG TPA: DapH/DapD/GlmU-related protein [Ilumatobacter sp.]|nr:DapH/DapD/GlmU-related protein [Ilumatobacter sp.]
MTGARARFQRALASSLRWGYDAVVRAASIGPDSKQAERFRAFGRGSMIRFPQVALMNEGHIEIGDDTMIGQNITLSAGTIPDQEGMPECVVKIGDRCLIGQGSGIVGHLSIEIGNDVMTGHLVYITDQNHGFEDVSMPIRSQWGTNRAVRIGSGSWIGHGSVILPGANIGRNVVIGANSVVRGDIPDYSIAAGVPARVVRTLEGPR